MPTQGFDLTKSEFHGMNLDIWELGGEESIRKLWEDYFSGTQGLIWVVNVSEPDRFQESKELLCSVLSHEVSNRLMIIQKSE
jgi:GTPase SAR1 family protein